MSSHINDINSIISQFLYQHVMRHTHQYRRDSRQANVYLSPVSQGAGQLQNNTVRTKEHILLRFHQEMNSKHSSDIFLTTVCIINEIWVFHWYYI